ncbi:MAG: saccharopine dehydrogenase NADP-binding domain-containing protein [Actinomycetota bacterium]|nr:saccharopine dehydrogenase NADP-binding domain-containing protein [Actinomycetota bacterium]
MPPTPPSDTASDIVLFGATGFVGRLVADYLAGHAPVGTRVALAGRSLDRLSRVQSRLGPAAQDWPLIVADSTDPAAMAALAAGTRVVATTVGPYARYGMAVAEACARAGTHYADLTGEVLFIRHSIDCFDEAARNSGARIVHACGYDSIPSDLGVLLLHEQARADGAGGLGETTLVARMKGGVSGGTIDSMRYQIDALRADPARRKVVTDPYGLSPDRSAEPQLGDERDSLRPRYDAQMGAWTAPFVMGPFNTRIVRRSNALSGWSYGRSLRYRETMPAGPGPVGSVLAGALGAAQGALMTTMALPATRVVLDRVLPKPGTGPSDDARRNGHFRSDIYTTTSGGARYVSTVSGSGDPGYAATAVMFGESALSLARDGDDLPDCAGVLTPATAMGAALTTRLRAAGLRCTVERR